MMEVATQASPGREPGYSRAQIAAAATAIADRDGIDAASMRRVAAAIGAKATSLYRYVRSKDELISLMVEHVFYEAGMPDTSGAWRDGLRNVASHARARLKRHPWLLAVAPHHSFGPSSLAATEATLKVLDGQSLDADGMLLIAHAIDALARGHAAQDLADQIAEKRTGEDRAQLLAGQAQTAEAIRVSGQYPRITRIIEEASTPHDPDGAERSFQQSLNYLLDGIEFHLGQRTISRSSY